MGTVYDGFVSRLCVQYGEDVFNGATWNVMCNLYKLFIVW